MAAPRKKKQPAFELDVDTRFEMTGRGKVTWFTLLEEDDYGKIGGNFFPDDTTKLEGIVSDLLAEAQAQCDEAGITVTQVDPIKATDDGDNYYKINRKAVKADGTPAVIQFKGANPKQPYELDDELGNGSTVAMKIYASAYYMAEQTTAGIKVPARIGVSLSPLVIQVIDHIVYDGGDDGFDNEADDMTDEANDAPFDTETADTGDSDY